MEKNKFNIKNIIKKYIFIKKRKNYFTKALFKIIKWN